MHHRMKGRCALGHCALTARRAAASAARSISPAIPCARAAATPARARSAIYRLCGLRGGTVVGDHSVISPGPADASRCHHAEDRSLFANGAIKAALWARGRKPGVYSMLDVLGLMGD